MQKHREIFTFGMEYARRNLTLGDIRANKASGTKMVQTNPADAETAAAAEAAGIDIIGARYTWIPELRKGAPNTYTVAALGGLDLISEDDVLRAGVEAMTAGADQLYTSRRLDIVEKLAADGFSVQGHVGLVPRVCISGFGLRSVGRYADEAIRILGDLKRLENAGAVAAEVECVPADLMIELSRRTPLVTQAIGSGSGGDVNFLFMDDIFGEADRSPRHARQFGDLTAARQALRDARVEGLKAFREASISMEFPGPAESTSMHDGEFDKFCETAENFNLPI